MKASGEEQTAVHIVELLGFQYVAGNFEEVVAYPYTTMTAKRFGGSCPCRLGAVTEPASNIDKNEPSSFS
ncbi:hypothetical protein ACVIN2_002993 [Bradyrhizobium sp. USDA 3650]